MSRDVELTIDIDVAPRHQGDDDVQHRLENACQKTNTRNTTPSHTTLADPQSQEYGSYEALLKTG